MGADERPLGHGRDQVEDERVIIRAGDAGDLVGLARLHLLGALDGVEVVGNVRGGLHRWVADALKAALEVLCLHGVTVVELAVLADVEGPLGRVVVGLPGLGRRRLKLLGVVVVLGEGIEQALRDLGALGLLRVVGVDGNGVVDVVLQHAARAGSRIRRRATRSRTSSVVLAASRETGQCGGCDATLDEASTRDSAKPVFHMLLLFHTNLNTKAPSPTLML